MDEERKEKTKRRVLDGVRLGGRVLPRATAFGDGAGGVESSNHLVESNDSSYHSPLRLHNPPYYHRSLITNTTDNTKPPSPRLRHRKREIGRWSAWTVRGKAT
jgi:hypothetical protein